MIHDGSLFTQVLTLIDRADFARAVRQWDAEKGAKGFRCWDQFVAMVFCQLAGADSLREIEGGLALDSRGGWAKGGGRGPAILPGKPEQSLLIQDTSEHPDWKVLPGQEHVSNCLGVPLAAEGKIIGLCGIDKTSPGFFTQEHRRLAEALVVQAMQANTSVRKSESLCCDLTFLSVFCATTICLVSLLFFSITNLLNALFFL